MALDRCRAHAQGRVNFPFASELFCLFFERFPEMRPSFVRQPCRSMFEARMHMWGKMMPKRGDTMFLARISHDALDLLASVDRLHPFILVPVTLKNVTLTFRRVYELIITHTSPFCKSKISVPHVKP